MECGFPSHLCGFLSTGARGWDSDCGAAADGVQWQYYSSIWHQRQYLHPKVGKTLDTEFGKYSGWQVCQILRHQMGKYLHPEVCEKCRTQCLANTWMLRLSNTWDAELSNTQTLNCDNTCTLSFGKTYRTLCFGKILTHPKFGNPDTSFTKPWIAKLRQILRTTKVVFCVPN